VHLKSYLIEDSLYNEEMHFLTFFCFSKINMFYFLIIVLIFSPL